MKHYLPDLILTLSSAMVIAVCIFAARPGIEAQRKADFGAVFAEAGAPVVVVDAGHGGFDGGALGRYTKVHEDGLNLAVARLVRDGLEAAGATVIMTRDTDDALGPDKDSDMVARRKIINGDGIDVIVSVHMNIFSDSSVSGPMSFYMKGSEQGAVLAQCVIDSVCKSIGRKARSANPGDYFMIRVAKPPSVIIECGFLSNPDDEQLLQNPEHQQRLADGIVGGVMAYLAQARAST